MTEVKPRLLLQHSHPDPEVSKLSSDSHQSLTDIEHTTVNGDSPSILLVCGIHHQGGFARLNLNLLWLPIETSIQNCLKVSQLWFVAICAAAKIV